MSKPTSDYLTGFTDLLSTGLKLSTESSTIPLNSFLEFMIKYIATISPMIQNLTSLFPN